jgi:hypothetical protein
MSREALPKTLFALSRCRIPKTKGSEDLLSRSPVHTGARDGEGYGGGAAVRRSKTVACLDVFLVDADRSHILSPITGMKIISIFMLPILLLHCQDGTLTHVCL